MLVLGVTARGGGHCPTERCWNRGNGHRYPGFRTSPPSRSPTTLWRLSAGLSVLGALARLTPPALKGSAALPQPRLGFHLPLPLPAPHRRFALTLSKGHRTPPHKPSEPPIVWSPPPEGPEPGENLNRPMRASQRVCPGQSAITTRLKFGINCRRHRSRPLKKSNQRSIGMGKRPHPGVVLTADALYPPKGCWITGVLGQVAKSTCLARGALGKIQRRPEEPMVRVEPWIPRLSEVVEVM